MRVTRVDFLLFSFIVFLHHEETSQSNLTDPEVNMTVNEIIEYHGYKVENHYAKTEDDYVLTMQRISRAIPLNVTKIIPRKPVLILHGFLSNSAVWVLNTPDKNLPYILVDNGYDVWLGNIRGSIFGSNNTKFTTDKSKFWDFSLDEVASYDLPAMIDKILNVSAFKQVFYVGHFTGAATMFALLASNPRYNAIVRGVFAMSPFITLKHIKGTLANMYYVRDLISCISNMFYNGKYEVNATIHKFIRMVLCWSLRDDCNNVLFQIYGPSNQINTTRLPVYLAHSPDSTSVKILNHLFQLKNTENFTKFNYDRGDNFHHYGQACPPIYNVSQIVAPVALFSANNDYLAAPLDVKFLSEKLKNLVLNYSVPDGKFSHLDFLWGVDAKKLVYDKILEFMKKLWPLI